MRFFKLFVIVSIPFLYLAGNSPKENLTCREIVTTMLDSVKNIKTQRCEVKSIEHTNGHMLFAESILKLNVNPRMIYYKNVFKGNEVLWVHGENRGNAKIHARSLPLVNIDLDPYGNIMRKDNHHTIFDLGFQYIASIIGNTYLKSNKDFDKHFTCAGTIVWNHIDCYQLIISLPEYKYVEYTVLKSETSNSIARKLYSNDYKIRSKNGMLTNFGLIKEGKKILVPIPYGNKVIVYIDKKTFMPINVKIYDEEGLFESYEFYNVKVNSAFAADEFTEKFKGYGF